MRILFASSEVYPFSKTGGLADVAGALPEALARLGHDVLVVSPWYSTLKTARPLWIGDVAVPFDGDWADVGVGTLEREGVRYAFVGHEGFRRDSLYGYADDVRRFSLFTRAVPQVSERLGFRPEVVHVNDWHTAYLPMVLAHGWHLPAGFPSLPSLLTVHNAQYQGESGIDETLYWLRLPGELRSSWIDHFGRANALQAGLGFADLVTTVSPTYAGELTTPQFGYSLEGTFRQLGERLRGILNGLDTEVWDPQRDSHLPQPYDRSDHSGKRRCKEALCRFAGLDPERPLLAAVSRLAQQKGIDLLLEATPWLTSSGWSLYLLGSGEDDLEVRVATLTAARNVAGTVGYNEELAHLVYAAADALAIPSRFEPCGLNQMIAMRYGTLPLARATGGLRDTIEDGRTGFLFDDASAEGIRHAADRAVGMYGSSRWQEMMGAAMARDFSWQASALAYEGAYRDAIAASGGSPWK